MASCTSTLSVLTNTSYYRIVEGNTIDNLSRNHHKRRAILKQVNRLAWLLDNSIRIPIINYRIGLDAIVGLVPGFGDIAGLVVSSFIVMQAMRLGVSRSVLMRMIFNITLEATIGMIPIAGDLFDATFKANARNVELLNRAMGDSQGGRAISKSANRLTIAALIGAMIGILILIGAAGMAVFSRVVSLFR